MSDVKRYDLDASLETVSGDPLPSGVVAEADYDALLAERDQLRAELEAIRGQQVVDDLACLVRRLVHQLRKAAPAHDLPEKAMDYLKRKGLQGSPYRAPQQPDAVSVPRELAERLEARMAECSPMKEHWDTLEELSALLSTKNAEEV